MSSSSQQRDARDVYTSCRLRVADLLQTAPISASPLSGGVLGEEQSSRMDPGKRRMGERISQCQD